MILASASPTRRRILQQAGLDFQCRAPELDEQPIKQTLVAAGADAGAIAQALSEAKALAVSQSHAGALALGADQVLSQAGRLFDKPGGRQVARENLLALSGKRHELATALALALDNKIIWRHLSIPKLTMRPFDAAFIDRYLDQAEAGIYGCVGAYMVEASGIQLFSAIEGDHFAIQGLPLLPLLSFLREQKYID